VTVARSTQGLQRCSLPIRESERAREMGMERERVTERERELTRKISEGEGGRGRGRGSLSSHLRVAAAFTSLSRSLKGPALFLLCVGLSVYYCLARPANQGLLAAGSASRAPAQGRPQVSSLPPPPLLLSPCSAPCRQQ